MPIADTIKPFYPKTGADRMYPRLREIVSETIANEPLHRRQIILKALFFPLAFLALYVCAIQFPRPLIFLFCYTMMGLFIVFNFFNLVHEAVHHTLFKNKKLNRLYRYLFDLLGANSYIWKIRHTRFHHSYPNIKGWDTDLEQSPLARIYPHGEYKKIHRYQHIYLPLLYPLFIFNWLLVRDFRDFFDKNRMVRKLVKIPMVEYVKLVIFKAFFLFYTIAVPIIFFHVPWKLVITGFLVMLFSASLLSLLALLSPHANTESKFPLPAADGCMETSWMLHQLNSTNDIAMDNWFTRYCMGCCNFHVAHHLFPAISHVYYGAITKIIQSFSLSNGLPYRSFPLKTSLKNHFRLLKANSYPDNIFEETM